jgi:transcriptional regulator with XRE-family HTH domain
VGGPLEGGQAVADVLVQFGKQLRRVRTRQRISQERLAERAGLHRTYVSSVERGLRNISLLNIDKLARALEVPLTSLMPRG